MLCYAQDSYSKYDERNYKASFKNDAMFGLEPIEACYVIVGVDALNYATNASKDIASAKEKYIDITKMLRLDNRLLLLHTSRLLKALLEQQLISEKEYRYKLECVQFFNADHTPNKDVIEKQKELEEKLIIEIMPVYSTLTNIETQVVDRLSRKVLRYEHMQQVAKAIWEWISLWDAKHDKDGKYAPMDEFRKSCINAISKIYDLEEKEKERLDNLIDLTIVADRYLPAWLRDESEVEKCQLKEYLAERYMQVKYLYEGESDEKKASKFARDFRKQYSLYKHLFLWRCTRHKGAFKEVPWRNKKRDSSK